MAQDRRRLGDILVEAGILSKEEIEETVKTKGSKKLGDALREAGLISEEQLLEVLEFQLGIPRVRLAYVPVDTQLTRLVSQEFAERNGLFPLDKNERRLRVAMSDPMDYMALDDLRMATGFEIEPVLASRVEIEKAVETYYNESTSDFTSFSVEQDEPQNPSANQLADDETEAPIIRMVNQTIVAALEKKASDIHLDPQETRFSVRYRIDGRMQTERSISKEHQNAVTARVKIMADLNITETRLPQDGRVKVTLENTPVDLRISTMPTVYGEKIVIRVLDMTEAVKEIDELDFNKRSEKAFRSFVRRPSGMVLITGPTGSGKTTTLYAALHHRNTAEENIITVEDPVEYQMEGINQMQVKPDIGLTFSSGLRAILRQDPDVVMVGEIRDSETAEIAVRASLTGHLVFSTIHTNSAVATIPRLIDMGVEPYLVMSSLSGIVSQRLVRRICPDCRASYTPSETERRSLAKRGMHADELYYGTGCSRCADSGYKGRMAVHEVLTIDDELRRLVLNQSPVSDIHKHLLENDMLYLLDDGFLKAVQGKTTMEEVLRVAAEENDAAEEGSDADGPRG
ncbi:GspE/PulE family protein [Alkalicoccus urumqiensis]|uniref:Type II secretion system protein GspE n=1 Tax=Alkalicoccus urumqiensis TaxID=1548213 RepID=A0A2P6MF56_ALKUR|nr:GspE/PulE family protein [Alkalicoccus urumqiensis]PRO64903.1 type II secretion system protein GspE [Alkalicoccus urumqiensis]